MKKPNTVSRSIAVVGCLAIAVSAPSVRGQEAPHRDTNEEKPQLEEILVTAQRTESTLSKTPAAVTALTADALAEARITNPTALPDLVPNLSIDRTGGNGGLQFTIRGVTSSDLTEKGDPSAAFLLDGIYIARPQVYEVSFFDLQRVEVLRGPQGTLYGRNTTAGLVNVISASPVHKFDSSVDATLGDFGTRQLTGMVNAPISESAALRAAVNYDRRDCYLQRNSPSAPGLDPCVDNLSGRLSFLFNPSDSVDVLLRADYSRMQGSNRGIVPASNLYQFPLVVPPAGERGVDPVYIGGSSGHIRTLPYTDVRHFNVDNNTWGMMTDISWRMSASWTLNYLGSYRKFNRDDEPTTFAGTVATPTPTIFVDVPSSYVATYWQNSQEVRFAFKGDRVQFQAGVYYFKEESNLAFQLIGLLAPNPGTDGYVFGFPQGPTVSKSVAEFAQGTFSLTDKFRLTAGVRFTKDDKSRRGATIFHANFGEPLNFTASATNPAPDSLNDAAVSYSKTTWRSGLEYDANDTTLLYGSIATGYKAGGFNDGCLAGTINCNSPVLPSALFYAPERLMSLELGVKTRIDGRVQLFADYFHYDYKDLQLSALGNFCGGPCTITSNAGKSKVDGIEVEGQFQVNERNRFDLQAAWLDARFVDYPIVPGVNLAGTTMSHSPKLAIGAGYSYTQPLSNSATLKFNLHSRYSSEYSFIAPALIASFRQPSFTKTDISLTYQAAHDRWYVSVYGKNLEDKVTVGSAGTVPAFPGLNNGEIALGDPRTVGARVGFHY